MRHGLLGARPLQRRGSSSSVVKLGFHEGECLLKVKKGGCSVRGCTGTIEITIEGVLQGEVMRKVFTIGYQASSYGPCHCVEFRSHAEVANAL